jgi:hypothetical protein
VGVIFDISNQLCLKSADRIASNGSKVGSPSEEIRAFGLFAFIFDSWLDKTAMRVFMSSNVLCRTPNYVPAAVKHVLVRCHASWVQNKVEILLNLGKFLKSIRLLQSNHICTS